jgi:uncharacterized membrane protein
MKWDYKSVIQNKDCKKEKGNFYSKVYFHYSSVSVLLISLVLALMLYARTGTHAHTHTHTHTHIYIYIYIYTHKSVPAIANIHTRGSNF